VTLAAWRDAVSASNEVRADEGRAEVFFRTVSRKTFLTRFRGWASAARASHYKVSGRAQRLGARKEPRCLAFASFCVANARRSRRIDESQRTRFEQERASVCSSPSAFETRRTRRSKLGQI
jgi:hypothetical protein